MKKSIGAILLATIMGCMVSCGSDNDGKLKLDFIPVQTRENAKWGFVGPDGKMLYEDEFAKTPSPVINGVFTVEEDNGISVYEATDKKPTLVQGLEELADAGVMNDGIMPIVRKNERIKLVDKSGKEKLTLNPVNGNEIIRIDGCIRNGIFSFVLSDDHVGVMNTSGKVLIEPKYISVINLNEDRFLALQEGETDSLGGKQIKYYLLDGKGKEIIKFKETIAPYSQFVNGKCLVMKSEDNIPGYINKEGEFTKLPAKIAKFDHHFNGKFFGFETEEQNTGIMNIEGEIIIRPKYKVIAPLPDDKFIVKNDDQQWFILNKNGEKEIVIDDMEFIIPLTSQGFSGDFKMIGQEKEHRLDLYDYSGKAVTQESFYKVNLNIDGAVISDYFNPEEIGRKMVSFIDANGVNGVKFNTPVSELLPKDAKAEDYSEKYDYFFTDLPKGYMWNLSVAGVTPKPIASPIYTTITETYWFSTYTRQVIDGYKFNEGVKISSFVINASSSRDFIEGAVTAASDALKEKGFKELPKPEEATEDIRIFKKGTVEVTINTYSDYDNEISISVTDTNGAKESEITERADTAVVDTTTPSI